MAILELLGEKLLFSLNTPLFSCCNFIHNAQVYYKICTKGAVRINQFHGGTSPSSQIQLPAMRIDQFTRRLKTTMTKRGCYLLGCLFLATASAEQQLKGDANKIPGLKWEFFEAVRNSITCHFSSLFFCTNSTPVSIASASRVTVNSQNINLLAGSFIKLHYVCSYTNETCWSWSDLTLSTSNFDEDVCFFLFQIYFRRCHCVWISNYNLGKLQNEFRLLIFFRCENIKLETWVEM